MAHQANLLKEKGNQLFKEGQYAEAETQYTLAITKNSSNPLLYTNRALARLRLQRWQGALNDCLHSIELTTSSSTSSTNNFKAYFYLAQAQLELHHPNEALNSALTAYEMVLHASSGAEATKAAANLPTISDFVLRCKKEKFGARERERRRRRGDILAELEENLEKGKRREIAELEQQLEDNEVGVVEAQERRQEIMDVNRRKVEELKSVFALADPENHQAREVPDYLVDTISFEIMHDPVTTKTGHSYERATLLQHLKRSPYDPLTREPLTIKDLRPNVALRQVLEEFWKTAGSWAIDW